MSLLAIHAIGPHNALFFLGYSLFVQFLMLLQLAFTVWMLVDAYRRGVEYFWYYLIFFFQPVGAWAYFFIFKMKDLPSIPGLSQWMARRSRPSLDELKFRVKQVPTFANQLELAERLMEQGSHADAIPLLEAALKREPQHGQVLFDLAKCHRACGQQANAIPYLKRIIDKDRQWSEYAAWRLLIQCQNDLGDGMEALATARELAQLTQTLKYRCLLGEHLIACGKTDEAREELNNALTEHQFTPGPIRRRNSAWATHAGKLLKQIG